MTSASDDAAMDAWLRNGGRIAGTGTNSEPTTTAADLKQGDLGTIPHRRDVLDDGRRPVDMDAWLRNANEHLRTHGSVRSLEIDHTDPFKLTPTEEDLHR